MSRQDEPESESRSKSIPRNSTHVLLMDHTFSVRELQLFANLDKEVLLVTSCTGEHRTSAQEAQLCMTLVAKRNLHPVKTSYNLFLFSMISWYDGKIRFTKSSFMKLMGEGLIFIIKRNIYRKKNT